VRKIIIITIQYVLGREHKPINSCKQANKINTNLNKEKVIAKREEVECKTYN
jgi:hypothetical protein